MKKLLVILILFAPFLIYGQKTYTEIQTQADNNIYTNIVRAIEGDDVNTAISNLNQTPGFWYYDVTRPTYRQDSSGVLYNRRIFINDISITSGEAWNLAKWTQISSGEMDGNLFDLDTNINLAFDEYIYSGGTRWLHSYNDTSSFFAGLRTGSGITSGVRNIGIGHSTGHSITSATDNIYIGFKSGIEATGSYNTYLGSYAGYSTSTGNTNTYIGYQAGYSNATGTGNIFIGHQAGYNETGSNELYIDNSNTANPLFWASFADDSVRVNASQWVTGMLFVGDKVPSVGTGIHLANDHPITWYNEAETTGIQLLNYNASNRVELYNNVFIDNNGVAIHDTIIQVQDSDEDTLWTYNNGTKWIIEANGDTIQIGDNSLKVASNGNVCVDGDFLVTGTITGGGITSAYASAYIADGDEAATTTTLASTYYFLKGSFTNVANTNFTLDGDTLQYTGTETVVLTLIYFCTFGVGQVSTTVETGILINDVVIKQSEMFRLISGTSDRASWGGVATVELSQNDKIKIVVKSDKAGGTVTAYRFSTILKY